MAGGFELTSRRRRPNRRFGDRLGDWARGRRGGGRSPPRERLLDGCWIPCRYVQHSLNKWDSALSLLTIFCNDCEKDLVSHRHL